MYIDQQKEQFSQAFVQAVATVAGYATYKPSVDDDSIDLGLAARGDLDTPRRPRLELQLKCTHKNESKANYFLYDLSLKNYNDLRADTIVPRLLVVVVVPREVESWLVLANREMCLRHYAYWYSLKGLEATNNLTKIRLEIPRTNRFTPAALRNIMGKVNRGEDL